MGTGRDRSPRTGGVCVSPTCALTRMMIIRTAFSYSLFSARTAKQHRKKVGRCHQGITSAPQMPFHEKTNKKPRPMHHSDTRAQTAKRKGGQRKSPSSRRRTAQIHRYDVPLHKGMINGEGALAPRPNPQKYRQKPHATKTQRRDTV